MKSFGDLEARIMDAMWSLDRPSTVHDVLEAMEGRTVAYTTAITVIERLREKGWLNRARDGRSYRYTATCGEDGYIASLMNEALHSTDDRTAALLNFAGQLDPAEAEELRRALGQGSADTRTN